MPEQSGMSFDGNPSSLSYRIGTARLLRTHIYRHSLEIAGWWRKVACEPQSVPLYSNGYDVTFGFSGRVAAADLSTLVCGRAISAYDDSQDIGKDDHHSFQTYVYVWAKSFAYGEPYDEGRITFELFPGYGVDKRRFRPTCVCDPTTRTHGEGDRELWFLTMPQDGHRVTVKYARERRVNTHDRVTIYTVLDGGEAVGEVAVPRMYGGSIHGAALRKAEALVYADLDSSADAQDTTTAIARH